MKKPQNKVVYSTTKRVTIKQAREALKRWAKYHKSNTHAPGYGTSIMHKLIVSQSTKSDMRKGKSRLTATATEKRVRGATDFKPVGTRAPAHIKDMDSIIEEFPPLFIEAIKDKYFNGIKRDDVTMIRAEGEVMKKLDAFYNLNEETEEQP